jgi:hypothetical protein
MTRLVSSLKQYRQEGERWVFVLPKKPKRVGQCKVIYCARPARVEVRCVRTGLLTVNHSVCSTCQSRLYRANNPAKEVFRQIKDRAQRRNQIFELTFDEFMSEIEGTEYMTRRGTGINELHLDRIEVWRGYVKGNIRVITAEENLRKQHQVDYAEPF